MRLYHRVEVSQILRTPLVTATASHCLSAPGNWGSEGLAPRQWYTAASRGCTPSLKDKRGGWGKKERKEKEW